MSIAKINNGPMPLQQQSPREKSDQQIHEASQMYEKYFLNEMVKAMRKTVSHGGMTTPSFGEKIYTEQLDQNYVEAWGDQGGIGLAKIIYDQLQERFFNGRQAPRPTGPIPMDKGTRIKIDDSQNYGIPMAHPRTEHGQDLSFLYEWDQEQGSPREVVAPYSGEVVQVFRNDERQTIKIKHGDGLLSTLNYLGRAKDLSLGDQIQEGQAIGILSPDSKGLTWQLGRIATGGGTKGA